MNKHFQQHILSYFHFIFSNIYRCFEEYNIKNEIKNSTQKAFH